MAKRKCKCEEFRREAEWFEARAAVLQGVVRRLVDLDDQRRELDREYERAILAARGVLHLGIGDRSGER